MSIGRREFVRGSAAGLLLGAARASADDRPIRWGIVGTGARCRHHITALRGRPGMEIVATCDVDEGRLANGLKQIGRDVPALREYPQLLARSDVDAVLVTTPNLFHAEIVQAALKAGKHILCEKPMATSWKDCQAMKQAAAASRKVVLYGLQLRYSNRFGDLQKIVRSGRVGAPKFLTHTEFRGDWNNNNVWQYVEPKSGRRMNWRYSQAASGGTLNEKDCHYFDILNWLVGALPKRITARGGLAFYKDRETWDNAGVTLDYPGGVRAVHSLSLFAPNRFDLEVIGETGSLQLMPDHVLCEQRGAPPEKIPLTPEVGHGVRGPAAGVETAVVRMYEDFAACVRTGQSPRVDVDTVMASSKIAFLAERSAALNRTVDWNEPL